MLAACSDNPTETPRTEVAPEATAVALPSLPEQVPDHARASERAFRGLARQVPAFAGFYLNDDGELVVQLTELNRGQTMRAAMVPFLQELAAERGNPRATFPEIVLSKVEYSFDQLSAWREQIQGPLFAMEEVVMIDLDERINRLTVDVCGESGRPSLEAVVQRSGVPLAAVRVEVLGEPIRTSGAAAPTSVSAVGCTNLTDRREPLVGGYQISRVVSGSNAFCTVSFTGRRGTQTGFVTNAHCSAKEWDLDGTVYYQPSSTSYPQIGFEVYDPRGWGGWTDNHCEINFVCRRSDANMVKTDASAVDIGYIARPSGVNNSALTVNPVQPRFTISATSAVYGGGTVYTIGRTSGMRSGRVTHTCADYKGLPQGVWHKTLCTLVSDFYATGGDSGGPTFLWNGTSDLITVVGSYFVRTAAENHAFSSSIFGIQQDLGVEIRAPEYQTGGGGGGSGVDCGDPDPYTVIIPTC